VTNATNAVEQWTSLWGISQTPSATLALPGGTTERGYGSPGGTTERGYGSPGGPPAVETFLISGMGHALAVDPGPAAAQCGHAGPLFAARICSTYYTAVFWGLP
jgi:hypothetical protein